MTETTDAARRIFDNPLDLAVAKSALDVADNFFTNPFARTKLAAVADEALTRNGKARFNKPTPLAAAKMALSFANDLEIAVVEFDCARSVFLRRNDLCNVAAALEDGAILRNNFLSENVAPEAVAVSPFLSDLLIELIAVVAAPKLLRILLRRERAAASEAATAREINRCLDLDRTASAADE